MTTDPAASGLQPDRTASPARIPPGVKWAYTAFMAVLVPYYLHAYGPGNFLWFCDIALLLTLIGLWRESPLLISSQAVSIVLPQLLWVADFACGLLLGRTPVGLAAYMFSDSIPLFVRGLSLFHGWMPLLLLWLVHRVGYDRRGLMLQVLIGETALVAAWVLIGHPDGPAGNVNRVFGWGEVRQTAMPPLAWLGCVMLLYPAVIYLPSHLLFGRLFPALGAARGGTD